MHTITKFAIVFAFRLTLPLFAEISAEGKSQRALHYFLSPVGMTANASTALGLCHRMFSGKLVTIYTAQEDTQVRLLLQIESVPVDEDIYTAGKFNPNALPAARWEWSTTAGPLIYANFDGPPPPNPAPNTCIAVNQELSSYRWVAISCSAERRRQTLVWDNKHSMMLWSGNSCTDAPFVLAIGTGNHTIPLPSAELSFRTNGLWALALCSSGGGTCSQRSIQTGEGTGCRTILVQAPNDVVSLTMFGNPLENERRLHLFDQFQFLGNETVIDNDAHQFDSFTARSYYFSGVHSFEPKEQVNGPPTCLNYLPSVGDATYGFTFLLTSNIPVGYVSYGCGGTSNTPDSTTPLPTSTPFTTTALVPNTTPTNTTPPTPLPTSLPPTFDFSNKPDGFYPSPFACDRYFGCRGGQSSEYQCSPPLHFNPDLQVCDFPEFVNCDLDCPVKEDGVHPHPHYCQFYLRCSGGVGGVLECPSPLLFDRVELECNFPDLVNCTHTHSWNP